MYTHENYQWGLVAYVLGFLLILPLVFSITRVLIPWAIPRNLVRLAFAAVLLTPVRAYTDMYFLAPAWMVAFFEYFKPTSVEGPARAVTPIVICFAALLVAYLGWIFLRHFLHRGK